MILINVMVVFECFLKVSMYIIVLERIQNENQSVLLVKLVNSLFCLRERVLVFDFSVVSPWRNTAKGPTYCEFLCSSCCCLSSLNRQEFCDLSFISKMRLCHALQMFDYSMIQGLVRDLQIITSILTVHEAGFFQIHIQYLRNWHLYHCPRLWWATFPNFPASLWKTLDPIFVLQ